MFNGSLYVLGEEQHAGPVKIGMTFDSGGKVGRGGLNTGNWRQLVLLGRLDVSIDTIRWQEWLTHHRLRHRHVRGEWFNVRDLANSNWAPFLEAVADGKLDDLYDQPLGVGDHHVVSARQPEAPLKHFVIECACGESVDGRPGRTLPSALTTFATEHLGLSIKDPLVSALRVEPSNPSFNLNPYEPGS